VCDYESRAVQKAEIHRIQFMHDAEKGQDCAWVDVHFVNQQVRARNIPGSSVLEREGQLLSVLPKGARCRTVQFANPDAHERVRHNLPSLSESVFETRPGAQWVRRVSGRSSPLCGASLLHFQNSSGSCLICPETVAASSVLRRGGWGGASCWTTCKSMYSCAQYESWLP